MSSCIHSGLLYQSSEQGHDAGGGGRAHSQGPHVSFHQDSQARSKVEMPAVPQAKSRSHTLRPPSLAPYTRPQAQKPSPEDRCEYNRPTPRTLVGKPSLLCPAGRAIHAARDGPPRAPTRPGSAGPGLRRRGKLWLSPADRLNGEGKDGSGVRNARVRRRGEGAYLRGSGATCG